MFEDHLSILNKLPEFRQKAIESGESTGMVPCACGKKAIPETEVRYHRTGLLIAKDTICNECYRMVSGFALIVCVQCQAVVARVAPCQLKSGFRLEAKRAYHTEACPNCRPEVRNKATSIIEAKLFYEKGS